MHTSNDTTPTTDALDTVALTIWHTYEQGTILGGTTKGDAASGLLGRNALGWKWSSHIITPDGQDGAWYIRMSREKPAKQWQINQAADRLREAGYRVDVHVDNTPRDMRDSEADRADHMADRAEALRGKEQRQRVTADTLREQADQCFPDNGQPLLVDHYSYPADLRRRERGWTKLEQSVKLATQADTTNRRVESAQRHMDYREAPFRVARRIQKLEADLRHWQRELAGRDRWHTNAASEDVWGHVDPTPGRAQEAHDQIAYHENQLTYWRDIRNEQIAAGVATNYGPDQIATRDRVQYNGSWYEVVRVNKKSVTINTWQGASGQWFTDTVRYDQIRDHRPASE